MEAEIITTCSRQLERRGVGGSHRGSKQEKITAAARTEKQLNHDQKNRSIGTEGIPGEISKEV